MSSAGCDRDIERLEKSQKGVEADVLRRYPVVMNAACEHCPEKPDDECHSTSGMIKGGERHPSVTSDH